MHLLYGRIILCLYVFFIIFVILMYLILRILNGNIVISAKKIVFTVKMIFLVKINANTEIMLNKCSIVRNVIQYI